jgi:non-homologous end joining protein Ku
MGVLEDEELANAIILRHADIFTGRRVLDDYRAVVRERVKQKINK